MKILFIGKYNETEILTGPEKVAKRLFEQISIINPDSQFITYFFKGQYKRKLSDVLFGKTIIQDSPQIMQLGIIKTLQFIYQFKPSIIHFVTFERYYLPVLLLKELINAKFIYTIHGMYKFERQYYYSNQKLFSKIKDLILERMLYSKSDKLIFLSEQSSELAKKYYRFTQLRIQKIPNGTLLVENTPKITFDFRDGVKTVFFDGSQNSLRRGVDILINILDSNYQTKICLTVLSNKKYHLPVKYLKLKNQYYLPEKKLFEFLSKNHIYIDSLNFQTFSLMALEAMSLGLIVIVSNQSGISSYIKNGKNGFIFNVEKPEDIKEIVQNISSAKYCLESISTNAIATAKELRWDKIASQYLKTYRELLK